MSSQGIKLRVAQKTAQVINEYLKQNKQFELSKFVEWCKVANKGIEAAGDVVSNFIEATINNEKEIGKESLDVLKEISSNLTNIIVNGNTIKTERERAFALMERAIDIIDNIHEKTSKRHNILIYTIAGAFICACVLGTSYGVVKLRNYIANTKTVTYKIGMGVKNLLIPFRK